MTNTPEDGTEDLLTALLGSLNRAREDRRRRDSLPCPSCGGDRLRADFTGSGKCHAPTTTEPQEAPIER